MYNQASKDLRIVFFGTPDFAVASLAALVAEGFNVVAVVTAPDKASGRGLQLNATPVKVFATQHNIQVLQPPKLKDPEFVAELESIAADMHIVVAFRMLPEIVWNMPSMGTINVHGSLLPQYRGAAPINWAIINGATETGVSTFKLKHEIDTGNILLQQKIEILPKDNAGILHDKMMIAGAALLVKTVNGAVENSIAEISQDATPEALLHAPKIFKDDTKINWNQPAMKIQNFIRGMSPNPAAFTILESKMLKIFTAEIQNEEHKTPFGNYETDGKTYLRFAAQDGWINVKEMQQEGKKKMEVASFLRGFRK